jgi:NADPH2:quinone reductase
MMKAIVCGARGAVVSDVPRPAPGPDEVLVRVHACGLNRADLAMAAGKTHGAHGGEGTLLGLEWAGEIVETGSAVTELRVGQRVMCSGKGGFAEYAVADRGRAIPVPQDRDIVEAACLPVALQTMHDALLTNGQLRRGQTVLIQGASSGVGLMGLQIARQLGAGLVFGSSTNPARRARLAEFGADHVIDSADPSWPQAVLDATGGRGVDLVVDQLAGTVANANLRATAIGGRIVNVGRLAGREANFDFDLHALRRIHYVGVTFRTRSVQEVRDITARMMADLAGPLAAGALRLPVDRVYPLEHAAEALARMAANAHFGKLALRLA